MMADSSPRSHWYMQSPDGTIIRAPQSGFQEYWKQGYRPIANPDRLKAMNEFKRDASLSK